MSAKKKPSNSLVAFIREKGKTASLGGNSHYVFYGRAVTVWWDSYKLNKETGITANMNDVCYARLRGKVLRARVFVNQYKREVFQGEEKQAAIFDYMEYILHRSPFSSAFTGVKKRSVWLRDGIGLNCNKGSSFVMAAITSLRECWEFPDQLWAWVELKKKGYSENEAYILSQFFKAKFYGSKLSYLPNCGSHRSISAFQLKIEDVKAFLKGEIVCKDKPIKEKCADWRVNNMLSSGLPHHASFYQLVNKHVVSKGGGLYATKELDLDKPELVKELKEVFNV